MPNSAIISYFFHLIYPIHDVLNLKQSYHKELENGQLLQEGNFRENNKDGEWKRYNENGEIEYHAEFKNGKLIKQHT